MVYCNVDHFHSMKLKYAMLYMMLFYPGFMSDCIYYLNVIITAHLVINISIIGQFPPFYCNKVF